MQNPTLTPGERRRVILLLSLAGLASNCNLRMLDSTLPQIATDLSVTAGQAGQLASAYLLAYGACQLPFGILGDRRGKYRLVTLFCLLSFVATGAGALAATYGQLWVLRLLAGSMAAAVIPVSVSWMGDNVPIGERQGVLAGYMAGTLAGMVLGQIGGGFVAEWTSWRLVPALAGLVYLAVGLTMIAYARRVPAVHGGAAGDPPAPLAAIRESLRGAWRHRILAAAVIQGMTVFAVIPFSGLLLADRFGLNLAQTGLILGFYAVGGFLNTLLVRRILRRVGVPGQYRIATLATCAGMLFLALVPGVLFAPIGAVLLGLGGSGMHNNLQTHATQIHLMARTTGFCCSRHCSSCRRRPGRGCAVC